MSFMVFAALFFGVGGLLTVFISARVAAIFYILLGAILFAGWSYADGRSVPALMSWYNHPLANSALLGYFVALAVVLAGYLFESRRKVPPTKVEGPDH